MRSFRFAVATAAVLLSAGAAAPRARAGTRQPTRYVLFLDCSPSVTPAQQGRWKEQGDRQIAAIAGGDALQIFLLHDNTATGAEVFGRAAPGGNTLSARAGVAGVRQAGQKAFACPSGQGRGRDTDVLSAIDRVPVDEGRQTVLIFFSDMLNSKPEADIERRSVSAQRMPQLLQAVAHNHRWTGDRLKNVTVLCVLNSLDQGEKAQSPNDRQTVRAFYQALFESLGARLERFDTSLSPLPPTATTHR